ncbi:hypothetical protein ACTPEN_22425, partial [Clostridioides difficile]
NTLALKNIEASLNNTLVELSEKIKSSFDSSDASVEELQNRITELTNQLSQRRKYASGTFDATRITSIASSIPINLDFTPSILLVDCYLDLDFKNLSSARSILRFATNLSSTAMISVEKNEYREYPKCTISSVSANSFVLIFDIGKLTEPFFRTANARLSWKAIG